MLFKQLAREAAQAIVKAALQREDVLGHRRTYNAWKWTGWVALLALVLLGWLWFVPGFSQHMTDQRAAATRHANQNGRPDTAVVVSRGPYAGDVASYSYRLAVIEYSGWDRRPVREERMVDWSVQRGQRLPIFVMRQGPAYLEADLNELGSNPYTTMLEVGTVWPVVWRIIGASILFVTIWAALYWVAVVVMVRWRQRDSQAAPA